MTRKLWLGAALGALVIAAMAPWSASKAHGVSVRVSTPEFGIRIGALPYPAYYPAPIYAPPPVIYRAAPRYIVPAPVVYGHPYYRAGGHWGRFGPHHRHHHWRQHGHSGGHDGHGGHDRRRR